MAKQVQFRGGTTAQHSTFTGANREITVDTDKDTLVVHDGVTVGGFPLVRESVVNLSLGTKVDKNANIIAGTATKITYDTKGLVTASSSLIASDIPNLDTAKITTGTLPVLRGGTGVTTSTGSGSVVLSTSPVLVTPIIGVATGTSFNNITGLSSTTPQMDGTAAVGTSVTVARADHKHPSDTTKVDKNANIVAGTYKSITVDVKGLVTGGTNPTTLNGYGITDAYTKSELNAVNLLRADKFLAAQNIAAMQYDVEGNLIKIRYNNPTDVNYEVLNYANGDLSSINHYVSGANAGTTTLSYTGDNLTSVIFA